MPSLAQFILEAVKPGLLGRAGITLEVRLRKDLALHFQSMGAAINLGHLQATEVGLIQPHIESIIVRASPRLESILTAHGKQGYTYGFQQPEEFSEAALTSNVLATQQKSYAGMDHVGNVGRMAAAYARIRAAESVTGLDDVTRDLVKEIIAKGIEDQKGVSEIVADLKRLFGDMSTTRARSIANTETNLAVSTAAYAKIKSIGLNYKRAIASPDACPICLRNQAAGAIPVDQPFPSGHMYTPFHPGRCRCAVTGVRDERVKDYGENSSQE